MPCDFCRSRNLTCCRKTLGPKTQPRVDRPVPTPIDDIILPQDVLLLQYAYSETFLFLGGQILSCFLRALAISFNPSINQLSLRHAILALAAAFIPSNLPYYERMKHHSVLAYKSLQRKTSATVNEADLFAECLLTVLSTVYSDGESFKIHIMGFLSIMKKFNGQSKITDPGCLPLLWPLGRDLILDSSRYAPNSTGVVFNFCYVCRQVMGALTLRSRLKYNRELFGFNLDPYYPFTQAMWQHLTLLRRAFRETICQEMGHGKRKYGQMKDSVVMEVKFDLASQDLRDIVNKLFQLKAEGDPTMARSKLELLIYLLAIHQLCQLLITLMEGNNTLQQTSRAESRELAQSLLELIKPHWLVVDDPAQAFPMSRSKSVAVRMLGITGIVLSKDKFPEGNLQFVYDPV